MSAKDRSIKQRLARAKSPAVRREIVTDWSLNWQRDQSRAAEDLCGAINRQDWHKAASLAAQLRAITEKRFAAFPGVLAALAGDGLPVGGDEKS